MCMLDEPELLNIRILSESDMGVLKLMAVSNRSSFKDVYDLHYLTEKVPLTEIFKRLKEKQERFSEEKFKSIFDLDGGKSSIGNLGI